MSPPPPYTILPATPSDIDALIAISEAAFAGDALIRQYFHPGVDLEATLRVFRVRLHSNISFQGDLLSR